MEILSWIVFGLLAALYVWYVETGGTTRLEYVHRGMVFAFNDHPQVFMPVTFGALIAGLLLAWRQYRRTGRLGIKRSLVVLLAIALVLFGSAKLLA